MTTDKGKRTGQAFLTLHDSPLYIADTVVGVCAKVFQSFCLKIKTVVCSVTDGRFGQRCYYLFPLAPIKQ
jgi:hypothetical protein